MNISAVDTDTLEERNGARAPAAGATARLLWAACRPLPDEAAAEAARLEGADLAWAAQVAVPRRVSPLLWRVVQRWAAEDDGWSDRLRDDSARCRAQAVMVRPRVGPYLLEPLIAQGLTPLVMKGAAVAERYPAPGLRPMDDVDLLVPPEAHREAMEVLRRAGWSLAARQAAPFAATLVHRGLPGLPVDLHHGLAARSEVAFRLTPADLWEARQPAELFGTSAYVLPPEMELLVFATHAGKPFHNFDRLIWAVDTAVVVLASESSRAPLDWGRVAETAGRAAARSALAVLLTQAERLGARSPLWLRDPKAGVARRRALDPPRSATWPLERVDPTARARLTYAVIDDPWLRVRCLLYQMASDGLILAPRHGAALVWRIVRRVWRLRRTPPGPRWGRSAEQGDEQLDPGVADREP